eukprot:493178_1
MASCGVQRKIDIFDPYRVKRLNQLIGHTSSVQQLLINEDRNQLISLSTEKVIKIWDVRNFRCVQTIYDDSNYRPENRISTMMFDSCNNRLVTGTNRIQLWPIKSVTKKIIKSHDFPLCSALYNKNFDQVVSGDTGGLVRLWDILTGQCVFRYNLSQHDTKITSMTFDEGGRRLITGESGGLLRMWNFSNGQCLTSFKDAGARAHWKAATCTGKAEGAEVSGLVYVRDRKSKFVISVGWDRKVRIWPDSGESSEGSFAEMPSEEAEETIHTHVDDILCISDCPPTALLATGGYDGRIVLWNFMSGVAKGSMLPYPGYLTDTQPEYRAVEMLLWLRSKEVLVSCGADGYLRFWNVKKSTLVMEKYAGHKKGETIMAMCVCKDDNFLVTCDGAGFLKVWDVHLFDIASCGKNPRE